MAGDSASDTRNSLAIFSIEPLSRQATYISISENTQLSVPFGYKSYKAGSIYKLGKLDKLRGGGTLLSKSIENTFGLSVHGYLIGSMKPDLNETNKINEIGEIKSTYFLFTSVILRPLETDISLFDRIKIWLAVRKIRNDQIKIIDLDKSGILEDQKLPDGISVSIVDTDLFDSLTEGLFIDSLIRRENISLGIINATSEEKIARDFSRILNHLGATVILKSTSKEDQKDKCKLFIYNPNHKSSRIVTWMIKYYQCKIDENNIKPDNFQADVKIVLGKDFLK